MNLKKILLLFIFTILLYSCADYKIERKEKKYYSSSGFALIYDDNLYLQKVVNKRINNDDLAVMHNFLKINSLIKIINPENSKVINTKIYKKANYPKIFNVVISKKIASILELDINNPFVEIIEIKKNKTFIVKKTNTFEEEKNVVEKVPIDEIKMDDLTISENKIKENKKLKSSNFILVINDFYYEDSAIKLKNKLVMETKMNNIFVKKINDKKYRLLAGPFKNFNALKTTYISLSNLGFENLNIYKNYNENP